MTAKEYLQQVRRLRIRMETLADRAQAFRMKVEGIKAVTYDGDRVQTSTVNRTEEMVSRLVDLEARYANALAAYNDAVLEREQRIEAIEDDRQEAVLLLRYIMEMGWEDIAERLGYSYRNVTRLHGKALNAFACRWKDVLECPM